jgi:hypothetical protein
MSELRGVDGAGSLRNSPRMHELPPVARCVHSFAPVMLVVLAAVLLGGCPPPPLELDEPDARGNLAPAIESVRKDDATEFTIGATNDIVATLSTMTLRIVDPDLEDTLYVRGLFNYSEADMQQTTARAVCNVGPSEPRSLERSVTCNLAGFCHQEDIGPLTHILDVVVSDREPDDGGNMSPRRYLDVPDPGKQDRKTFAVTCSEPPPT